MFDSLTEKFTSIFDSLRGKKKLTEANIAEAVSQVRLALLDADVNYSVAKTFVMRVKEKALGDAVIKAVAPGQQFVKVIHDELAALMGSEEPSFHWKQNPSVLMLCGLQGSGKTTQAAKLAKFFASKQYKKKPLLVACDLQRPAAVEQLKTLGRQVEMAVFSLDKAQDPVRVAIQSIQHAREHGFNLVILDTAGRLHVDEGLMEELGRIKQAVRPDEILFVANAATGQDAVKTADAFNKRLEITGTILTMLDGDARAGAAISIYEATGKPLKFEGIGEKLEDLQLFNARSMADRILGMGDTINLVKRAKEHIDEQEAKRMEEKLRKASFTYEDCLKQMQAVRKMGSLKGLLKMIPGASKMLNFELSEKEFQKIEGIILSMTPREREEKDELDISRMKRIARGSGTDFSDVTKLKKTFKHSKQFFKDSSKRKFLDRFMGG